VKYYSSKELMQMSLSELKELSFEQLIEGICTLEITIYTLESNGYDYSKESTKQDQLKELLKSLKK